MRGATPKPSVFHRIQRYFNPRSSCEERHGDYVIYDAADDKISIHAPHARSDSIRLRLRACSIFQSTLLMRGATCTRVRQSASRTDFNPRSSCEERHLVQFGQIFVRLDISIHAPHARSDAWITASPTTLAHFNPRSSWEERPQRRSESRCKTCLFQSTLLMRGATRLERRSVVPERISIHAPHARSDRSVGSDT